MGLTEILLFIVGALLGYYGVRFLHLMGGNAAA